jgi:hypothetical protein
MGAAVSEISFDYNLFSINVFIQLVIREQMKEGKNGGKINRTTK